MGWMVMNPGSIHNTNICHFSTPRPDLGPTQPPNQQVLREIPQRWKQNTNTHLIIFFLFCSVYGRYMQKFVANIKLINYVTNVILAGSRYEG